MNGICLNISQEFLIVTSIIIVISTIISFIVFIGLIWLISDIKKYDKGKKENGSQ
ncbi:MAG TPA: hypothetical protein VJ912_02695 [Candidatus Nanoarchaeia archaeon]|nr:hypothetical protein [Candidatus Nanoarchaeia archaeon]